MMKERVSESLTSHLPSAYLRVVHAAIRLPHQIAIYIDDQKWVSRLSYGHITVPIPIRDGSLLTIIDPLSHEEIYKEIVHADPEGTYTLALLEKERHVHFKMFRDDPVPVRNRVKLRFIPLAPNIPCLYVSTTDHVLFSDVAYGESRFLTIPAYASSIYVQGTDTTYHVPSIHLQEGKAYTLFIVESDQSKVKLLLLKES
jgi:hypothetical protein